MSPSPIDDLGIQGVVVSRLRTFSDERGTVFRMLRYTDAHFSGFGEVYFSSILPGVVKAWKKHDRFAASYVCAAGRIRMVLYGAVS